MNRLRFSLLIGLIGLAVTAGDARAQFERKWLSGGDLHNWYSAVGAEVESQGFVGSQQDGFRWPGIYDYTDMQAWMALWIGARNVVDEEGNAYPVRVVHAGPRVTGADEFFPVQFDLVSRFALPVVFVDGLESLPATEMIVDEVDETIAPAQMIVNRANTLLGLTMERRIMQWQNDYHDDYHLFEYTFTNTGNTDADDEIELPDQTLTDVVLFLQWRWAIAKETRYVIGNGTGWGMNTMIDELGTAGGPNYGQPYADAHKAVFAWHGNFPAFTAYDNLGGPILPQALPAPQIAAGDTLGRLGATQFIGTITLHADASATDETHDPAQPFVTTWTESDATIQSQNDPFTPAKMEAEYALMTTDKPNRHAYVVEPSGTAGFLDPTGDPALGTSGGYSAALGYGPYTIAPGESIRFVIAEAAGGLSREANTALGRAFKEAGAADDALLSFDADGDGTIESGETMTKNAWVFTSRDSLFQTFDRALANYASGYGIPQAPAPPALFEVNSGGNRIQLNWDYAGPEPAAYEIYRARGSVDSTYTLVHVAEPGTFTFDDTEPIRGIDYYYYIVAVSSGAENDGTGGAPAGVPLRSSRYYTQTYEPARLLREAGEALADIRVVPNPFNVAASADFQFGGGGEPDRLGFLNIPGQARIEIYTETGELIDTNVHDDGSGDAYWDLNTSSGQFVASGLYIAVITNAETGEAAYRKFVVIR